MLKQPARTSLADQTTAILRQAIIANDLPHGAPLVEENLANRLGVSRAPLREALRRLATEGLAQPTKRGFVVIGMTDDDINEIYDLRGVLEPHAARLALENGSQGEAEELHALLAEMETAVDRGDRNRYAQLDVDFHSYFYRMARHRRLYGFWESLAPSVQLLLAVTNVADRDLSGSVASHRGLLAAFDQGDLGLFMARIAEHLSSSRSLVVLAQQQWRAEHAGSSGGTVDPSHEHGGAEDG